MTSMLNLIRKVLTLSYKVLILIRKVLVLRYEAKYFLIVSINFIFPVGYEVLDCQL